MWLFVGLGNPGNKYLFTRHNVGFMAIDYLVEKHGRPSITSEHKALTAKIKIGTEAVLLAKPQTYMNLSGQSVQALMNFYKIDRENLVVIHDEVDQKFMHLKLQKNRGPGGHNGIKSIHELIGSPDYIRLRIGVGRPLIPQMDVADYVLQNFNDEEMTLLPQVLKKSSEALEMIVREGLGKASTLYNGPIQ